MNRIGWVSIFSPIPRTVSRARSASRMRSRSISRRSSPMFSTRDYPIGTAISRGSCPFPRGTSSIATVSFDMQSQIPIIRCARSRTKRSRPCARWSCNSRSGPRERSLSHACVDQLVVACSLAIDDRRTERRFVNVTGFLEEACRRAIGRDAVRPCAIHVGFCGDELGDESSGVGREASPPRSPCRPPNRCARRVRRRARRRSARRHSNSHFARSMRWRPRARASRS